MRDPSVVEAAISSWKLTEAEGQVLRAALISTSHDYLRESLGVAKSTLKSHVASILGKTHEASLDAVVRGLRAEIIGAESVGYRKASGIRRRLSSSSVNPPGDPLPKRVARTR